MTSAIELKGLKKEYKDFTLGEINLSIPQGFSTALIGANGAGKTTLIDVICGVASRTDGEITYFSKTNDTENAEVKSAIGYCSANNHFPLDWKAKTIARAMEIAFDNFDRSRFVKLCEKFKLDTPDDKKQKQLIKMSDGNKMRMYLASVLARDTKMLVLDEPGSSLDPLMRDMLCDIFREYIADGSGERSILFSTHNIADMEYATDYAVFMADGKVCEQGFVEELKEKYILVHGDMSVMEKAAPLLFSYTRGGSQFEGIALSENAAALENLDCAVEMPNLQQLSVGILRKAEKDNEK